MTHALVKAVDAQLLGPVVGRVGAPPGHEGHLDPGLLRHLDAVAVPHVKDLKGLALGVEIEATVGKHPVHIQYQQADILGALPDFV
jgi:hypothetical protein